MAFSLLHWVPSIVAAVCSMFLMFVKDPRRHRVLSYIMVITALLGLIRARVDFDGTEQTLEHVNALLNEVATPINIEIKGPFFPQNEALLYIFTMKTFEQFNQAGRIFLTKVNEEGVNITPVRYEVAITPEEFWEE